MKITKLNLEQLHSRVTLMRDIKTDPESLLETLTNQGYKLIPSSDGIISRVKDAEAVDDWSKRSTGFDWHQDGLYLANIPDFVLLYCTDPGRGETATIYSESAKIASEISDSNHLKHLEFTKTVYVGKNMDRNIQPTIYEHPVTGKSVLRIPSRGHLESSIPTTGYPSLRQLTEAGQELFCKLDQNCSYHHWKQFDILIIDNHQFVHGRADRPVDFKRELVRIWFSAANLQ